MKDTTDKIKVVLVDDDEDDRMLFGDAFSELNINSELWTFENGLKFLEYVDTPKADIPDLIFLDLNMPIMGGIKTLEILRRCDKYKRVPIAILSTSKNASDVEITLARGADIYIIKPSSLSQLKKILGEVVKIQWQNLAYPLNRDNFVLSVE